jgi:hypothetical protein
VWYAWKPPVYVCFFPEKVKGMSRSYTSLCQSQSQYRGRHIHRTCREGRSQHRPTSLCSTGGAPKTHLRATMAEPWRNNRYSTLGHPNTQQASEPNTAHSRQTQAASIGRLGAPSPSTQTTLGTAQYQPQQTQSPGREANTKQRGGPQGPANSKVKSKNPKPTGGGQGRGRGSN